MPGGRMVAVAKQEGEGVGWPPGRGRVAACGGTGGGSAGGFGLGGLGVACRSMYAANASVRGRLVRFYVVPLGEATVCCGGAEGDGRFRFVLLIASLGLGMEDGLVALLLLFAGCGSRVARRTFSRSSMWAGLASFAWCSDGLTLFVRCCFVWWWFPVAIASHLLLMHSPCLPLVRMVPSSPLSDRCGASSDCRSAGVATPPCYHPCRVTVVTRVARECGQLGYVHPSPPHLVAPAVSATDIDVRDACRRGEVPGGGHFSELLRAVAPGEPPLLSPPLPNSAHVLGRHSPPAAHPHHQPFRQWRACCRLH